MLTLNGYGAVSSARVSKLYGSGAQSEGARGASGHQYDSADFSAQLQGEAALRADMVGRMAQEIRAATTTGDVQELRQAVANGQYTPDPMAIAGRIMLSMED